MQLPAFKLIRPQSLGQALEAMAELGDTALVVAGGTDLLVRMKQKLCGPQNLISLQGIRDLQYIQETDQEVRIGSCTKIATLENNPTIKRLLPAVAETAGYIAGPQHRSMGTIGGNLALDTRCWYYNQSASWRASSSPCFKTGGSLCHMVPRSSYCRAVFSGDLAPLLIVLGASVVLRSAKGERLLPLEQLYRPDGQHHLNLVDNEILTEIRLPKNGALKAGYRKYSRRQAIDFPVVGLAFSISRNEDGIIRAAKACAGAIESRPLVIEGLDKMVGQSANQETEAFLLGQIDEQARPTSRLGGSPPFKRQVLRALCKEVWREATTW